MTNTPTPELVTLLARFNAAIEAVSRRSDEIGEDEWYEAGALESMHHIGGEDAALIAMCSPANLHVLCHYANPTRAATVPQGVWLPIDSAPRTGIAVLLFQPWKSARNCTVIGHYANGWVGSDIEDLQPEPTHWQPLPTPPPAELGKVS